MTRPLRQMPGGPRRERAVGGETGRLAGGRAAARRAATLAAGAAAPEEIFSTVAGELARLSGRTSRWCPGTSPPGLRRLRAELGQVAAGLAGTPDELRRAARG